MISSNILKLNDWVLRYRQPEGEGPHPTLLLLHGWTGDEDAMWIFASRLPRHTLLLAPRGLYATPLGGFGWHPHQIGAWPSIDDFRPAVQALLELLTPSFFPGADFARLSVAGFSQGAALAYALALLNPQRLTALAGLSGFTPRGVDSIVQAEPLKDLPVFVAHGSQDDLVSVERARRSVETLEDAGARVTYCEEPVGHKLSAACFRGLETFFSRIYPLPIDKDRYE